MLPNPPPPPAASSALSGTDGSDVRLFVFLTVCPLVKGVYIISPPFLPFQTPRLVLPRHFKVELSIHS